MDLNVLKSYIPLYNEALLLTVKIGLLGILTAFVIGLSGAAAIYFRIPVIRKILSIYIELFRNTPLLVQLFFIYFALPKLGIRISAELCGVMGLGLIGGAYMIETMRSGLESIAKVQSESALSLGLTEGQVFLNIILPQAFSVSMPGIMANVIFLLKETSVFSTISLMDLMFTAKDLIGMYAKTIECLFLLVIYYLVMLLPVSILGSIIERRVRFAEFGD
ncbi:polar amino acid transport system permease protein [Butyrivibrio sp. ob235]|uniref:amino acid ABC transporter permease n=1 Tax=Butyrivibrio sp. ob235 TaxID=1761780 RepID=UPI0008CBEE4D|nr:amino acid ABC transporter permease [Butyrivibrio sp. ob235]SEL04965.1 polar amino acid transport system permease protein [Butyrivibrio sp. ob235]